MGYFPELWNNQPATVIGVSVSVSVGVGVGVAIAVYWGFIFFT